MKFYLTWFRLVSTMERHSDASRQSTNPAVTTTTKTFRSFGVVIVLVIFIFGYTALTMNHSRSVYYGGKS
jgi:Na+/melibiose symporter-like transporter